MPEQRHAFSCRTGKSPCRCAELYPPAPEPRLHRWGAPFTSETAHDGARLVICAACGTRICASCYPAFAALDDCRGKVGV